VFNQKNNFFWFKINGSMRQIIIRGSAFFDFLNCYTINEYPKSGGSWLGQMIAEALEIPFPRNSLPHFGKNQIMHGHYINPLFMKKVVLLWRDGRDVLISQYYHSLFENGHGNRRLVSITKENFIVDDYNDIRKNLPQFIEYTYKENGMLKFSWSDFVDTWIDKDVVHVRYEDLREDTPLELIRIVKDLSGVVLSMPKALEISKKYSFERMSGRVPGEEDKHSFVRKGVVGDWKNHFSKDAKKIFNLYAGDALIKSGYEKDGGWLSD
jgi:hypothetical protein